MSINTLRRLKKFPRAVSPWALDSGAFSELSAHGKWTRSASDYAHEVFRVRAEIGNLDWCAPQDWMCEPFMLSKTGLDIQTHQRLTVGNFLDLRGHLGATVIPVLQGWSPWDYLRHCEMYEKEGINLRDEATIGVGSICRRQHTAQACTVLTLLNSEGLKLHAFGLKILGLKLNAAFIQSADSMAWSFTARRQKIQMPGCTSHRNCANCRIYAEEWRKQILPYLDPARD